MLTLPALVLAWTYKVDHEPPPTHFHGHFKAHDMYYSHLIERPSTLTSTQIFIKTVRFCWGTFLNPDINESFKGTWLEISSILSGWTSEHIFTVMKIRFVVWQPWQHSFKMVLASVSSERKIYHWRRLIYRWPNSLKNSQIMDAIAGSWDLKRAWLAEVKHVTKLMDFAVNCINAINVLTSIMVMTSQNSITMSRLSSVMMAAENWNAMKERLLPFPRILEKKNEIHHTEKGDLRPSPHLGSPHI